MVCRCVVSFKKRGVLSVEFVYSGPRLMGRGVGGGFGSDGLPLISRIVTLCGRGYRTGGHTGKLHTGHGGVDGRVNVLVTRNGGSRTRTAGHLIARRTRRLGTLRVGRSRLSGGILRLRVGVPGVISRSIPINGSSDRGIRIGRCNRGAMPSFRVPCRASVVTTFGNVSGRTTNGITNRNFCCLVNSVTELRSTILSCTHSFVVSGNFACYVPPCVVEDGIMANIVDFRRVSTVVCGVRNRSLCLVNADRRSVVNGFVSAVAPRRGLPLALADCSPYFEGRGNTRNVRRHNVCHVRRFRGRRVVMVYGPDSDVS